MDYHLIIIGGGAAGKDAALFAARAGIKTLLVEKDQLGGTSYHRGCYAMRALQACASATKTAERSERFGIGPVWLFIPDQMSKACLTSPPFILHRVNISLGHYRKDSILHFPLDVKV